MNRLGFVFTTLLLVLAIASSMLFVVDQRQFGILYALGQIKEVITEPGLNFKLPPPFQNVTYIDKRLLTATPSLVDALRGSDYADMDSTPLSAIAGDFRREPVENDWHVAAVTVADGEARWTNQAGVSWSLVVRQGALYSGPDCPYGELIVEVELGDGGRVAALWFGGERYGRAD